MINCVESRPAFADPSILRYASDAMKTTYLVFVAVASPDVVDPAVSDAFQKLEHLECLLSRYIPGSDIARINAMKTGESLFVSDDCDACLRLAIGAMELTGGRFDPCAGCMVDAIRAGAESAPVPRGIVSLDPVRPLVTCSETGRILDLGAIGKGYALECMAEILARHGIGSALLTSGASTMLATGGTAWPVDVSRRAGTIRLGLCGVALAASGSSQQGPHIVNPLDGSAAGRFQSVWVVHPRAALADAFSTACFVMTPEEIAEFANRLPSGCRVISDPDWETRVRLPQE